MIRITRNEYVAEEKVLSKTKIVFDQLNLHLYFDNRYGSGKFSYSEIISCIYTIYVQDNNNNFLTCLNVRTRLNDPIDIIIKGV